jgi:hypothetical protein
MQDTLQNSNNVQVTGWTGFQTGFQYNQPTHCPGCGKCHTCGRPQHEIPNTPTPVQPYWYAQPQTWPTSIQGGQGILEQSASSIGIYNSPNSGIAGANSEAQSVVYANEIKPYSNLCGDK